MRKWDSRYDLYSSIDGYNPEPEELIALSILYSDFEFDSLEELLRDYYEFTQDQIDINFLLRLKRAFVEFKAKNSLRCIQWINEINTAIFILEKR